MLKGAVSTLQQPRGQGPLSEVRGENRRDWPRPFCPSTHIAGLVANAISVVRNILFVYEKNSRAVVAGLVAAYVVVTLAVESMLGFPEMFWMLPLVINVAFTLLGHLQGWRFKLMNGSLFILWLLYDVSVANYVSAPFDIANIIANGLAVYRIRRAQAH